MMSFFQCPMHSLICYKHIAELLQYETAAADISLSASVMAERALWLNYQIAGTAPKAGFPQSVQRVANESDS